MVANLIVIVLVCVAFGAPPAIAFRSALEEQGVLQFPKRQLPLLPSGPWADPGPLTITALPWDASAFSTNTLSYNPGARYHIQTGMGTAGPKNKAYAWTIGSNGHMVTYPGGLCAQVNVVVSGNKYREGIVGNCTAPTGPFQQVVNISSAGTFSIWCDNPSFPYARPIQNNDYETFDNYDPPPLWQATCLIQNAQLFFDSTYFYCACPNGRIYDNSSKCILPSPSGSPSLPSPSATPMMSSSSSPTFPSSTLTATPSCYTTPSTSSFSPPFATYSSEPSPSSLPSISQMAIPSPSKSVIATSPSGTHNFMVLPSITLLSQTSLQATNLSNVIEFIDNNNIVCKY